MRWPSKLAPLAAYAGVAYGYGGLGRLIKVSYDNGKDVGDCYDDAGNRRAAFSADTTTTPLSDSAGADPPPPPEPFERTPVVVPLSGFTVIPIVE